ncbi:hypothetical protein HX096_12775 [Empedobacter falsenii]|uniref:hypothetical protein n=1 Tax=Empedobacter falsenii TaxID=343874 RepID=UPI0025759C6C|nr:hypothetical protein [Empedobacter falsenii]MDM1548727.1 hypothetical protein [Empedobacter falsenii]
MKLTKELFTKLNEAKKQADTHAFNVDVAIQSLQNICEHHYESDSLAGQYELPCCKICGFEFKGPRHESKRPESIVIDDVNPEMVKKIERQFEFLINDKSMVFSYGDDLRGIRLEGNRPKLIKIRYQNIQLDKKGLLKYLEYIHELYCAMQ